MSSVCFSVYFTNCYLLTTATTAPTITKAISSVCSKCGIIKKTGISSCCARRGSWFQDCGDAGDENFGHTWLEGIQSCKGHLIASECICITLQMMVYSAPPSQSKRWFLLHVVCLYFTNAHLLAVATTASAFTKAISSVCSKCGTFKTSGINSCCASGGSWFQDCGDAGDDKFGHTWFNGILACSAISSLSGESQSRRIPHEKSVVAQQARAAEQSQSTGDLHHDHVHAVVTANCKGCDMLTSTVAWTSVSLIFLYV